jgi:hypothetical protein
VRRFTGQSWSIERPQPNAGITVNLITGPYDGAVERWRPMVCLVQSQYRAPLFTQLRAYI